MVAISEDQAFLVARASAHDRDGQVIGSVSGVFYDDHTGRPEWVTVKVAPGTDPRAVGADPRPDRFVPLAGGSYARGRLTLDVTLDQVHGAPGPRGGDHLDRGAETTLYRHYGLSPAGDTDVDPRSGTTPRSEGRPGGHSLLPAVDQS